ncbi:dynamin family protein [Granulicoccus sp. GXG6511]|uniref:dynamin family protein n=1 Tax=Granulicoccus sp. GXG6511 TaxID=3381351 RepID=UPI003D7E7C49
MTQEAAPEIREEIVDTLKQAFAMLREHDRQPVVDHAQSALRRRTQRPRVVIVGETKRGKSTLTNALIGRADLSPVGADETSATFLSIAPDAEEGAEYAVVIGAAPEPQRIPLADLPAYTDLTQITLRDAEPPLAVDVHCAPGSPVGDVTLIDTPGVGGALDSARGKLNQRLARDGGILLFVLDAGSPMAEPELNYLTDCARHVEEIVVVVTMIDKYPHTADRIVTHVAGQLRAASPRLARAKVLPVQARAALAALRVEGEPRDQLWQLSGLEPLIEHIAAVRADGTLLGTRTALRICRTGLEEITQSLDRQVRASSGTTSASDLAAEERRLSEIQAELGTTRDRWQLDYERAVSRIVSDSTTRLTEGIRAIESATRAALGRTPLTGRQDYVRAVNLELVSSLELLETEVLEDATTRYAEVLSQMFGPEQGFAPTDRQLRDPLQGLVGEAQHQFDPMLLTTGIMGASLTGGLLKSALGVGAAASAGTLALPVLSLAVVAGAAWLGLNMKHRRRLTERTQLLQELSKLLNDFRVRAQTQVTEWFRDAKPEVVVAYRQLINRQLRETQQALASAQQARNRSAAEQSELHTAQAAALARVQATIESVDRALARAARLP